MKHKLLDIARRLLILLLVVWTVVSLVTILIELVPGDPAIAVLGDQATPEQIAQFRHKHGLDRPAFFFSYSEDATGERHLKWNGADNRYVDYWSALLHGDMGRSFRTDRPVVELILTRYGVTIQLAIAALPGSLDASSAARVVDDVSITSASGRLFCIHVRHWASGCGCE